MLCNKSRSGNFRWWDYGTRKVPKTKNRQSIKGGSYRESLQNTNIEFAKRQNDAGMLGALYNF